MGPPRWVVVLSTLVVPLGEPGFLRWLWPQRMRLHSSNEEERPPQRRRLQAQDVLPNSADVVRCTAEGAECGEIHALFFEALDACNGPPVPAPTVVTEAPTVEPETICPTRESLEVSEETCERLGGAKFTGGLNETACDEGPGLYVDWNRCVFNCSCQQKQMMICSTTTAPTALDDTMLAVVRTRPELSHLFDLVKDVGFESTLQTTVEGTLFAPRNEAFDFLPANVDLASLSVILQNHVALVTIPAAELETYTKLGITTLTDDVLTVTPGIPLFIAVNNVPNSNAEIVEEDILASNGVVHIIDHILLPTSVIDEYTLAPRPNPPAPQGTIYQVLETADGFSTLVQAFNAAPELLELITDPNATSMTLFAPTNEAFEDFDAFLSGPDEDAVPGAALAAFLTRTANLTDLLRYHLVDGVLDEAALVDELVVETLLPGIPFEIDRAASRINIVFNSDPPPEESGFATFIAGDSAASNGLVHFIDTVLRPPLDAPAPAPTRMPTIIDVANTSNLTYFVAALEALELTSYLDGSLPIDNINASFLLDSPAHGASQTDDDLLTIEELNFTETSSTSTPTPADEAAATRLQLRTAFAPTNEAFEAYFAAQNFDTNGTSLEELLGGEDIVVEFLEDLLLYHIVDGAYLSTDLASETTLTAVQGDSMTLVETAGSLEIIFRTGTSTVTERDLVASNGVLHIVDTVLEPPPVVCLDSPSWFKKDTPWKDCQWVSAHSPERCDARGHDNSDGFYSCPAACHSPCGDSTSWYKRNDPSKDCTWASSNMRRCDAKGQDGSFASDACPVACDPGRRRR